MKRDTKRDSRRGVDDATSTQTRMARTGSKYHDNRLAYMFARPKGNALPKQWIQHLTRVLPLKSQETVLRQVNPEEYSPQEVARTPRMTLFGDLVRAAEKAFQ
jgi:hypothetical protein